MKCLQIWKAPACVMFIVGGVVSAFAQAQDADWKFYGGKMQFCFYDNNSMTPAPNGYKVEIVCISPKEVDSIGAGRRRMHEVRYEINCSKRLVREVQKHEELGWTFPAAGSHEATLLDLLCKSPLETESESVKVHREQQQEDIARTQDAGWKFYGGKMQFCFYDNNSMTPIPGGYDVKIKCIDPDEMGGVDIQKLAWFAIINCTRRMARLEPRLPGRSYLQEDILPGGVLLPGAPGGHLSPNNVGPGAIGPGAIDFGDDATSVQGTSEAALVKIVCEL